eukprot:s2095_g20.t1
MEGRTIRVVPWPQAKPLNSAWELVELMKTRPLSRASRQKLIAASVMERCQHKRLILIEESGNRHRVIEVLARTRLAIPLQSWMLATLFARMCFFWRQLAP